MLSALLKELGAPLDATICETIAAQAAVDHNEGGIDLWGLKMFLKIDARDEQGQHEHALLQGPDFPLISDETALSLLKLLQG